MPPTNYRVSQSAVVAAAFRQALDRATAEGRRPLFVRAARYAWDELAYDPLGFGESRGFLPGAQLHARIAFVPRLYVQFGVHEPSKQVFVLRVGLLG